MRPRALRSAVVLGLVAGTLSALPGATPAASATPDPRPNIVVVMTDDQRFDSLANCLPNYRSPDGPGSVPCMPNVRSLLQDHGMTFSNSFVSTSVCCPSRSSFLTGLYAHNHGVLTNEVPFGGFDGFAKKAQASTLATWLHGAGYRTSLVGKYLNGYTGPATPPGWDDWHVMFGSASSSYSNFKLVENGVTNQYSKTAYHTTVLGQKAVQFVNSTPADQPLFLYFAPHAPHYPYTPAKGDGHDYENISPWRPPSYDEADVSDKSPFWQSQPQPDATFLGKRDIDQYRQLETLEEVDRQIGNIVTALGPRISNTLIVFTSDNGLTWGEHRDWEAKGCEFEECQRVPLVIRFDPLTGGIASTDDHPVMNVDLTPTIVAAAGATDADGMDGRSMLPLLAGTPPPDWRTWVFGENFGSLSPIDQKWPPSNQLIETFAGDTHGAGFKYVESCERDAHVHPCPVTFTSFYDENADPYELCNLLSPTACGPAPPSALVASLTSRVHALEGAGPPVLSIAPPPATSTTPVSVSFSGAGLNSFRCSLDGSALADCSSPYMPPGQSHGPHTLTVVADGPGGTAAPDTERWWISDRIPATPSFDSAPSSPSGPDVSFSFSDTEAGVAFRCALDRSDWAPCSSPQPVTGIPIGDHSFAVAALDADGNLSFPAVHEWRVQSDVTPPSLTMKKPAVDALLTARTIAVQWTATDDDSGLDRVEVRQLNGPSGTPVLVQSSLATSFTLNGAASGTFCYRVTAFDRQGNSRTGQDRCAAVPLDDRELGFTGPVTLLAPPAAFDATATRMTGAGSTSFTFTGRKVGVLFRKGPDLGDARIVVDGGTPKLVDLYGTKPKALWWTRAFDSSGPHTVVVSWTGQKNFYSSGTDVAVDGVAAIADAAPQPA